jgi:predicted DCC family thiol-disulfide oxidoreductase YuxK
MMSYYTIYDGNCNLCVNFVRQLEEFDRGKIFQYIPMQDEQTLSELGVNADDCEQGMMRSRRSDRQITPRCQFWH